MQCSAKENDVGGNKETGIKFLGQYSIDGKQIGAL